MSTSTSSIVHPSLRQSLVRVLPRDLPLACADGRTVLLDTFVAIFMITWCSFIVRTVPVLLPHLALRLASLSHGSYSFFLPPPICLALFRIVNDRRRRAPSMFFDYA